MSVFDSISDFLKNAVTGNLSQHQLQEIKADVSKDIAKASAGANPAVIVERQKQAAAEIENFVRSIDAHPNDAGLRLPGLGVVGSAEFLSKLNTLVKVLWTFAILALVLYGLARVGGVRSLKKAAKAVRG